MIKTWIDPEVFWILVPIMTLAALSPGPDVLFVLSRTRRDRALPGIIAALGIGTGLITHALAITFGCGQLFEAYPISLTILQYLGAAYLAYMAYMKLRHLRTTASSTQRANSKQEALSKTYTRGCLNSMLNPKAALAFIALFPQFVEPTQSNMELQLAFIGALAVGIGTLCHLGLTTCAHIAAKKLPPPKPFILKTQNAVLALLFGGLAVKLAIGL